MNELELERYLSDEAVELAEELLRQTRSSETRAQRRLNRRLLNLVERPEGMRLLVDLADQVLRIGDNKLAGQALRELIAQRDLDQLGDPVLRMILRGLEKSAHGLSPLVVPVVKSWVRNLSERLLIDGSYQGLRQHLDERLDAGFGVNLNWLGEMVLGETEAQKRRKEYISLLAEPNVNYLSVKISNLCSQLKPIAFETDLGRVCEALREIYRAAIAAGKQQGGQEPQPKFINLDMEEAHFVELTLTAFVRVLSEPEFFHYRAGLGLQAYLPESFSRQRELTAWAMERAAAGGAPIKLRLVKGANLPWERVQAELTGWPCPVFEEKLEVDANFKRMIEYALEPERTQAVQIGVGSHNLFDLAWARLLAQERGVEDALMFEFLEGMANAQAEAVRSQFGQMLLYAPAVRREQFSDGIAYLMRRLDENTQPENFLRHIFDLDSSTRPWRRQEEHFRSSVRRRLSVSEAPRRQQPRAREQRVFDADLPFDLEPVSDFGVAENRAWVREALSAWQPPSQPVPVAIAAESVGKEDVYAKLPALPHLEALEASFFEQKTSSEGFESQPLEGALYRVSLANKEQVEAALKRANRPSNPWRERRLPERKRCLSEAVELLAKHRAELLATLVQDTGKGVLEADAEVSLAIDLANHALRGLDDLPANLVTKPAGAVVVAVNWREPLASCIGACVAALVGGNSVLLRADLLAALSSWRGVELLWKAGVPREALQFVPTAEDEAGLRLLTDESLARVVFVGQRENAELFLEHNPRLPLLARTSSCSSILITACADLDLAIESLLKSAFRFAGQSEANCFFALVERRVLQETRFLEKLVDAVESLSAGSPVDLAHGLHGLLRKPHGVLAEVLEGKGLKAGQKWLVKPKQLSTDGRLWSPGVLLGAQAGDEILQQHLPAALMAIVEVEDLAEGIAIQNAQQSTAVLGLQSLSEREIEVWLGSAQAGSLFVNRGTNEAKVQRQPMGGWQRGQLGQSAKWGGRNFTWQFVDWEERGLPWEVNRLTQRTNRLLNALASSAREGFVFEELSQAASSYSFWQAHEFGLEHEVGGLKSERNVFSYRALEKVVWRVQGSLREDARERLALARFALACSCTETELEISCAAADPLLDLLAENEGISLVLESAQQLSERVGGGGFASQLVRSLEILGEEILRALHGAGIAQKSGKVFAQGRVELLGLYREQVISLTRHRHGHLMEEDA